MKLTKIEVQTLRVFKNPLVIADLQPGINLFAGRNGIGKSSLGAALRAAFFERAKSDKTKHLKPLDDPGASPRVSLSWTFGETTYDLTKEFAPKRRCTLVAGPQAYDGEDAEDHLATMFGYTYAGKGLNRADNLGAPGLLWIEQGTGQDVHDPVSFAGEHLKAAVASIAGVVASTAGDAVIDRLYAERDALLTRAQGRPTGEYAKAIADAENESARVRDLTQEISEYQEHVDALAKIEFDRRKLEAEKPWVSLEEQAAQAKTKLDDANDIQARIAEQKSRLASAEKMLPLIADRISNLEAAASRQADAQTAVQVAAETLANIQSSLRPAITAADEADRTEETARIAMDAARIRTRAASLRAGIAAAKKTLSAQQDALDRARKAQQERIELAAKLGGTLLHQTDIDALRGLEAQVREADIQIGAVGTRLQFEVDDSVQPTLDGAPLRGSGSTIIEVAAEFVAEGIKLSIEPGGSDLAALLDARTEANNRLELALARYNTGSAGDLEARFHEQQQLTTQAKLAEAALLHAAPEGLPTLELELQSTIATLASHEDDLAKLVEAHDGPVLTEDDATHQWTIATGAARAARENLTSLKLTEQQATDTHQRLLDELKAATELVNSPARIDDLASNKQELAKQRSAQEEASARIAELKQQLESAHADVLQADYDRLSKSASTIRQRLTDLTLQAADLGGLAKGKGSKGLEEQRAEAEVKLAAIERRRDQMAHRAQVISYLLEKIEKRKEQARQNLLEPLQKRVDHYIRMFMPGVSVALTDDMAPEQLTSTQDRRSKGTFLEQSFGTREQLGLICRLAYADILQEAGRPTLIILDDALVHSDDDRLDAMKRVIYDAGTRHQMLVFTCHPSRWQDLGVPVRDFAEMVRAAA